MNGKNTIETTERVAGNINAAAEKKADAITIETVDKGKATTAAEARSDIKATKETTKTIKPKANTSVSGEAKAETKVKAAKE